MQEDALPVSAENRTKLERLFQQEAEDLFQQVGAKSGDAFTAGVACALAGMQLGAVLGSQPTADEQNAQQPTYLEIVAEQTQAFFRQHGIKGRPIPGMKFTLEPRPRDL